MLAPLLISIVLVAITVVIHAYGTHHWMRFMKHRFAGADGNLKPSKALPAIIWTAVVLLMLHVIQVVIWAVAYRALPKLQAWIPSRRRYTFRWSPALPWAMETSPCPRKNGAC